jgi:hypothetical protein
VSDEDPWIAAPVRTIAGPSGEPPAFDDLIWLELAGELPEGTMAVEISSVKTTAGEVRISNQMLSGRFERRPLRGVARARFWLRFRAIRSRERVALWIAPWLWDD